MWSAARFAGSPKDPKAKSSSLLASTSEGSGSGAQDAASRNVMAMLLVSIGLAPF
jgi:hypothetical protein